MLSSDAACTCRQRNHVGRLSRVTRDAQIRQSKREPSLPEAFSQRFQRFRPRDRSVILPESEFRQPRRTLSDFATLTPGTLFKLLQPTFVFFFFRLILLDRLQAVRSLVVEVVKAYGIVHDGSKCLGLALLACRDRWKLCHLGAKLFRGLDGLCKVINFAVNKII